MLGILGVEGVDVMALFKVVGVLMAFYTTRSAWRGAVFARSGAWGRMIRRDGAPACFWTVIVIYGLLSLALLTVF